ncbi:nickel pincer cofactor biosynthesis protein LarB [bacterium]|nr:nickel pincer cofactor biosynthesis protein LarB [bacterium]
MSESLQVLLAAVAAGELSPEAALERIQNYQIVGNFARIDHRRSDRTGFPEVVYGASKTPEQIAQILLAMRAKHPLVMATRIESEVYDWLKQRLPELHYYPMARICTLPCYPKPRKGTIGVLCAGTSDLPVGEEAAVTAELCGFTVLRLWDVGVAGIHRLLNNRDVLARADVLIAIAGMEGALPSVVAGLVDCPVVAVPTSVGYGASFNGLAPLLTMLNSCAPGIGVVNIDNGFGGAILAGQILRTAERLR